MKGKAIIFAIASLFAVSHSSALNVTPGVVEQGDRISFSIPVDNTAGEDLANVRVSVLSKPAWLTLSDTALLGPITLPPGEGMTYRLDFEVNATPEAAGEVVAEIVTDTPDLYASRYVWHFKTNNSFLTYRAECLDEEGASFGGALSPDNLAPETTYVFEGKSFDDEAGTIFIAPATTIRLDAEDQFLEDAVTSEVFFTGYKIDPSPIPWDTGQLTPFENSFSIAAEGTHLVIYASSDSANNAEVFRSLNLVVDGTVPGAPVGLKADGGTPSPWKNVREFNLAWSNPADVSGIAGARIKLGAVAPVSNDEGDFYPADSTLAYLSPDLINGSNPIWVWLEDNVGNANFGKAVQLVLRYDDIAPVSNAAAPLSSNSSTVVVSFAASDEGAAGDSPTGSGVKETVFWYRKSGEVWNKGETRAGSTGTISFNTQGSEGTWEFYTQAFDKAGNSEPAPGPGTPPKAQTIVDVSAPTISGITFKALSPSTALIEWATDDETTAVIDYGRSASLGSQFSETISGRTHSVTLTGLPSPADIYFRITAANKTGLSKISPVNSFKTPLDISYTADIFGVIDYTQPVTLNITNPDITEAAFTVDGQSGGGSVTPGEPFTITVNPEQTGAGSHDIVVNAGSYEYTSSFFVDNAVRTVKLARLVIDAGGVMAPLPPAQPVVDATFGQTAQEAMSNGESRLYLGYYAGIDPVAPGAVGDLQATAGPSAGQISLKWTAPGDDGSAGTAMKYEIRYSPEPLTAENLSAAQLAANIPVPAPAGTVQSLSIPGLENGKTYYFAVKVLDELLNASLSNIASVKTLEVARSSELIGELPVVEVVSAFNDLAITRVEAESQDPAIVVARDAASVQSRTFYSEIFGITPSRTFEDGAQVNFRYTDPGDPEMEAELKVYKFNPTLAEWVAVEGVVDAESNIIRAVTYSFSLYAVLGIDHTPPVTSAVLTGGVKYTDPAGNVFVSGGTKLSLSAVDPSSGAIARIEYRVDSANGPFMRYVAPVDFAAGWHSLQYRSVDKAGNEEAPKSLFLMRDALEPRIELNFEENFSRLPSGVIHISSTSGGFDITAIDQPSSGSGLKTVRLELDGATQDIADLHSVQLALGRHSVRVWAEDNVGNIAETSAEIVVGDLLPPVIAAPAANFVASESTVSFSWQHQTTNFFSLTEYDLLLGAEPGFSEPLFTQIVSSQVKVTLLMDEAGVSVQGLESYGGTLRLITEQLAEQWTGALVGTMVTPYISLPPNTTGISSFTVTQSANDGNVSHEYSIITSPFAEGYFYPIAPGEGINTNLRSGGSLLFRSTLRRNALTDTSPTVTKIEFVVTYVVPYYNRYCHKHCTFCTYHCHDESGVLPYSYQTSISALGAISHEGLRISSGAVELITETGALTGEWLSRVYSVPDGAYRIGDFLPDYETNGGVVSFEFSRSGAGFKPIAGLESEKFMNGDTLQLKAVLSRATSETHSPVFRGIRFNFIAPPPTEIGFSLPEEGKYYWRVVSKDYLGRYSAPSEERLIIFDTNPPLTELLLSGATGQGGWHISPVSAGLISTDAVAGVSGVFYSVDGSTFAKFSSPFVLATEGTRVLKYYSVDAAGNTEERRELAVRIDLSSPVITAVILPAPNAAGWNNTAAGVVYAGSDTVSGLAYCSSSTTITGEGAGQEAAGICYDNAGLSSTAAARVSIDKTAPSIQYVKSPASNGYGWHSSSVTLKFTCADSLSGVRSCPADLGLNTDGANISTSAVVYDFAGNFSSVLAEGIKIDRAPPISGAALSGTFRNGWYSSAVTLTLASTDSLSGVEQSLYGLDGGSFGQYSQPVTVSADGAHSARYYARDKAGNSAAEQTISFSIDRTAPQVGFALSPQPNTNGWNVTRVDALFRGTDTLSGVEACTSSSTVIEGLGKSLAGWCRDLAGNVGYSTAVVNIDLSSPVVNLIASPAANAYGWNKTDVRVAFNGSDLVSGVAGCTADKIVVSEGASLVTGNCVDRAGLTTSASRIVNVDKTPPVTAASASGTMANGWYSSAVLLSLASLDNLSGVDKTAYRLERDGFLVSSGVYISTLAASSDGRYALYYSAMDRAGNSEGEKSLAFNVDRTAPVIAISSPSAGAFIATRGSIDVRFSVSDNLDPAPVFAAYLEQLEDRGSPRLARPVKIAVADGQSIEPLDIDDGIWRLAVSATDFADNSSTLSGATFEVIHDVLAPRTGRSITGGPSLAAGATTYITNAAGLELASLDDLVLAGDGIGLGVKDQTVRLRSAGVLVKELAFKNPAPKQGESFSFGLTGEAFGLADGIYSFAYAASDVLGNIEVEKSFLVGLDNTAPVSTAALAGIAGDNGWHISTVTVSLSAEDSLSGVASIAYALDDSAPLAYTNSFDTASEGPRAVRFFATDKLGNTEAERTIAFKIDRTPPAVGAAIMPSANADGWHKDAVRAGFSGTDAVSGIAYCEPAKTLRAEGRGLELKGYCRDYAGLTSTATARFNIDLTSPTAAVRRAPLANERGWNNTDVKISYECADSLSGIRSCPAALTLAAEGAGQGAAGTAVDYAGNNSSAAIGGINIDKTAPESTLSVSGELWEAGRDRYLSLRSKIILTAADGLSGVEAVEYHIDGAPFGVYASSLSLAEGLRAVHYRAVDKADNVEAEKTASYRVDGTSPETFLKIVGGSRHPGPAPGSFYASLASRFALEAVDPVTEGVASGVRRTTWSDNGGILSNTVEGLAFGEGRHVLAYSSIDNVENHEVARSTTILVDNTAPVTTQHIGAPYYAGAGVNYITPATPLTFTAEDPLSGEVASGVGRVEVSIDGSAFGGYGTALNFGEGRHTIKYRAVDNVGNMETAKTIEVESDNTPPASKWRVEGGDSIELGGRFYLNAQGKVALESADPVAAGVASGLEAVYYGVGAAPSARYAAPFGLSEGIRTVNFAAKDNLGNTEAPKSATIYVDGAKPVSELAVSGDQYRGDRLYVSTRTGIIITSVDPLVNEVASGVRETRYSVDDGVSAEYSLFNLPAEGKRVVSYYSADQVRNTEAAKTAALWVDDTSPMTALSVAGPRHDKDGLIYITSYSGLVLAAEDPVSAETASGVLLTKYRIDGGDWQVYAGSITIAGEGRHTLEYYSLDRVRNAEALRTAALAVDNTPPATTITLGVPKSEAFGLPLLTPDTPITLTAADVTVSETASGLKQIYYEAVNLATGASEIRSYLEPFRLAQGTWDVRYWSVDNVGNNEIYKQRRLAVTTLRSNALSAVEGLEMSGTADIAGAVQSNFAVSVAGNARILGDVTAGAITLSGKAGITGLKTSGAVPLSPEPIYLGAMAGIPVSSAPAGYVLDGKLVVSSQSELTLSTGIYHFAGMELSGGCKVRIEGKVDILVSGNVSISGSSSLNAEGAASSLNLFVDAASSVTFTGGGSLVAALYAPLAHLKLAGNAQLGGHFFVKTAAVSGTGNILQAGETLPQTVPAAGDGGGNKKVKAMAAPEAAYGVLAGPDPAFRLGEVYVFPNPAKGGADPTLHVETGIADAVKITFYTVSGRQAHEASLTGMPAPLDDGNGLSYAYEYTWRGHIPSGVYYYHIEAEKGGQKLKKSGKFAVVR